MPIKILAVLLLLAFSLLSSPAFSRRAAEAPAPPSLYTVAETAPAAHAIDPRPPSGCFVRLNTGTGAIAANAPQWFYVRYKFICDLKPTESISLALPESWGMGICDTGDQGAYICGLHGHDSSGHPIDRPMEASPAEHDARAIPDLVNMLAASKSFESAWPAAALEEYAADPVMRPVVETYRNRLVAMKAQSDDDQKKGHMVNLLLALGVEQTPGDSQLTLTDYIDRLQPKHLTALQAIEKHPDDPGIDPAKLVFFYVRDFVDIDSREDPNRAALTRAVAALRVRLQPSIGLLIERRQSAKGWPDNAALAAETAHIICSAFTPAGTGNDLNTLVIDHYSQPQILSCP